MNKKIIISLGIIGLAAAIAIGATTAFFSDTETSTGNTFTAGAIDLTIDNESYVTDENGALVYNDDTSWELDDLTDQLFFNFEDLKPGDIGEDTISLHVDNNDAWACMSVELTDTPENEETEPEAEVDDGGDQGELQDELHFAFWADDGDNVYETEELIFAEGLAADLFDGQNWTLADASKNIWTAQGPIAVEGEVEYYIGKVWCYGNLIEAAVPQGENSSPLVRGTGFICDGESVTNISQTDGIEVTVEFYAEQSRNNPNFTCVQPTRYLSAMLHYSGTGWGGWSCPGDEYAVGGGVHMSDGHPIGANGVAEPGATIGGSTYPAFPHYIFGTGETGYVLQNGGIAQTIQLYVDCLPK